MGTPLAETLAETRDPDTVTAHDLPVDRCDTAIALAVASDEALTRSLTTCSGQFTQIADLSQPAKALAAWR